MARSGSPSCLGTTSSRAERFHYCNFNFPSWPGMTNMKVGLDSMRRFFFVISAAVLALPFSANAAEPAAREPYGIGLEGFAYPYPVNMLPLTNDGYRVVVPDQIGFGKSSKPSADLHFDTLARNTIALLDHLQIAKAEFVAHSLGGMLGVRIARAYPDRVAHLLLAAPIGLEDYRLYVPPTATENSLRPIIR